jgi:membrane-associated phospholipid phosphatase
MGVFEMLLGLWFLLFGVLGTAFWIWMIIECATKEPDYGNTKLAWLIIVVFTHFIGAAIYYFVRRPQRYAELAR